MNAYVILQEVRANIGETSGERHWTDAELLRKLNGAYRKVYFMMSKAQGDLLLTSTDLTPSSSVITLPDDFNKFIYMEEKSSGYPIQLNGTIRERRIGRGVGTSLNYGSLECYFVGDTIEVNQDSYSTEVTLWYEKGFKDLIAGVGTTGSTTNTIVLEIGNSPRISDDYYNSETIEIETGTGIGTSATVTDYDGATYTLTLSGTFGTDSGYGSVLKTPEEATEFIVLSTTLTAMAKPSASIDPKYFEYFMSETRRAEKDLKSWLSSRRRSDNHVRITEVN